MAKALALWAGVLAASLPGCSPFGGAAFTCDTDESCGAGGAGKCEANHRCSFLDDGCGSGRRYGDHSGDVSGVCVGEEPTDGDGIIDASPPEFCYGAEDGLVKPCLAEEPTGNLDLSGEINTDSSSMCKATTRGGEGYCVIAAATIRIESRVTAIGGKPLVLVAKDSIDVTAALDAASHRNGTAPYMTAQAGAGSNLPGCNAGDAPGNSGGGAGGSFAGPGGTGGDGAGPGDSRGRPGAVLANITTLRGGCPGQDGLSGTPGKGGRGGGAVYLIAGTQITISAVINASGEGGHPGITGAGGGGGGGSGGMIGLDAPMIVNESQVFANGASGGEGSGTNTAGDPGPEPNSTAPSPAPQGASGSGGDGGGGSGTNMTNGGNGQNGSAGGGGGGGGIGIIKVRGATSGAGTFSPVPS